MNSQIPEIVKKIPSGLTWRVFNTSKVFLTFDDGPTPDVTEKVLKILDAYSVKATFFCLGRNAEAYPHLLEMILNEGHRVGNHTYSHLNGWVIKNKVYFNDIDLASRYLKSDLFRPPYGKIKPTQIYALKDNYKVVMWDVLSYDYKSDLTPNQCADIVFQNVVQGSIIVFHDSLKASKNVLEALPIVIEKLSEDYEFGVL